MMKLFTGLRKLRELQRTHVPFIRGILEYDIVIEIGFAEELGRPITLKRLFLLNISSPSTVRRKLGQLVKEGTIIRQKTEKDQRSSVLSVAAPAVRAFGKYGGSVAAVAAAHFK
jgi:hypothetical protein